MIQSIARVIATEVVNIVRPELEKLVNEAQMRLKKLADDAIIEAFKALDRNKDGKIDLNDLFNR